ncbi:hypothetical protein ABZ619_09035 [Streptomyces sp. NPDC007851]|uniref:hypothetical protein n=1 Tax=Streptomyces sp. NPDC007851 TaxID=3155008 RepID=UPI0033FA0E40
MTITPPTAGKKDPTCHSPLLYIGGVTLRPSSAASLAQFPDAKYALCVDIIGPPEYRVELENVMLFLTITDPTPDTVFFVQHADTGWHWGLPESPDGPAPPTARPTGSA